jgi:GR25 family glycosyltransferase involved in LPS biosynthesis
MSIAIGGIFLMNRYILVQTKLVHNTRKKPISASHFISVPNKPIGSKILIKQIAMYIFCVLTGKLFLRLAQTILPFLKVALLSLAKNKGMAILETNKAINAVMKSINTNPNTVVMAITMAHDLRTFFWSLSSFL